MREQTEEVLNSDYFSKDQRLNSKFLTYKLKEFSGSYFINKKMADNKVIVDLENELKRLCLYL